MRARSVALGGVMPSMLLQRPLPCRHWRGDGVVLQRSSAVLGRRIVRVSAAGEVGPGAKKPKRPGKPQPGGSSGSSSATQPAPPAPTSLDGLWSGSYEDDDEDDEANFLVSWWTVHSSWHDTQCNESTWLQSCGCATCSSHPVCPRCWVQAPYMDAVVKVYCVHTEPNYSLPWQRKRSFPSTSTGTIVWC